MEFIFGAAMFVFMILYVFTWQRLDSEKRSHRDTWKELELSEEMRKTESKYNERLSKKLETIRQIYPEADRILNNDFDINDPPILYPQKNSKR